MFNTLLFLEGSCGLGKTVLTILARGNCSPEHTHTHMRAPRLLLSTPSPLGHSTGRSWDYLSCNAVMGLGDRAARREREAGNGVASQLWMLDERTVFSGLDTIPQTGLHPGESKCALDMLWTALLTPPFPAQRPYPVLAIRLIPHPLLSVSLTITQVRQPL